MLTNGINQNQPDGLSQSFSSANAMTQRKARMPVMMDIPITMESIVLRCSMSALVTAASRSTEAKPRVSNARHAKAEAVAIKPKSVKVRIPVCTYLKTHPWPTGLCVKSVHQRSAPVPDRIRTRRRQISAGLEAALTLQHARREHPRL